MATRWQQRGHPVLALAVLAFILVGVALPIVIGGSGRKVVIESAGLQASPRDLFTFTSPMRLPGAPQLTISRGKLTLAEGQAAGVSSEHIAKMLAGGSAKLVLTDARILLDFSAATAAGEAAPSEDEPPLLLALLRMAFESVAIRNAEIVVRKAGEDALVLYGVTAGIVHKRKTALIARGSFGAMGQRLELEATLGLAAVAGKGSALYPLKASLKGPLIHAQVDGRLTAGDSFKIDGPAILTVGNLRSAARWLGQAWPLGGGLADFRAKGQAEWNGHTLSFQKASLQMDGNEAAGALTLNMASGRPSVDGTLAFDTLDLSRYGGSRDAVSRRVADVLQRAAGHDGTDLSLPLIRHLDADIRISANRVRLAGAELSRSAVTMTLKAGKMTAEIAELEHEGGRGSGQISVDMNTDLPRFGLRGKLTGFDIGKLASTAVGQQVLQGRGDMTFDLAASGETVTQFLRTLEGKGNIEVNEGARLGIDLNALLMAPQRRVMEGWSFLTRGQTPVEQLACRFVAAQGTVTIEALETTTTDSIVSLAGTANLSQRMLDAFVKTSRRMAGSEAQGEPVSIRGPWSSPVFRSAESLRKAADGPLPLTDR